MALPESSDLIIIVLAGAPFYESGMVHFVIKCDSDRLEVMSNVINVDANHRNSKDWPATSRHTNERRDVYLFYQALPFVNRAGALNRPCL